MRFLACVLATAVAATAQSPLTTTFANNNGGAVGGAVYFDIACLNPAGVTINQIDLNLGSPIGTPGTIDLFVKPVTVGAIGPIANWIPISLGNPVTAAGVGQPSVVTLSTPLPLGLGCTFGIGVRANGVAHAYTNGLTGAFPPGTPYSNADLQINAGLASNVAFSGTPFNPRNVNCNVHYTVGGVCPDVATVVSTGSGCLAQFASIYENFATAAGLDLANTTWTFTNTGTGYVVTPGGTFNPVGSLATPTVLALTDDNQVAAGTLGVSVGSNGWIALGAGNSNSFTPAAATFLGNPATGFYVWHDLNPAAVGSGTVKYEELGTQVQVTFDGVYRFGGTSAADANNFQFQYDTATGNAVIAFGAMSLTGNGWLVGYSPGGPNADPGSTDWSTITASVTASPDVAALSLAANGRPVQGAAPAAFQVTTNNIPASAIIHAGILGLSNPGLPLFLIGAPGCTLNASLDVVSVAITPGFTGPSYTWTALNLPALPPGFSGFQFHVSSAILGTPQNGAFGLGVLTANGLQCTIGTL